MELKHYLHPESASLLDNPIFQEMFNAASQRKPLQPKLPDDTWDPEDLLNYMLSQPDNNDLDLMTLSGKCVVLLMLASGRRKCDLLLLSIHPDYLTETENNIKFTLAGPSKGFRTKGHQFMQTIDFVKYPYPPPFNKICPYTMVKDYIRLIRNNSF